MTNRHSRGALDRRDRDALRTDVGKNSIGLTSAEISQYSIARAILHRSSPGCKPHSGLEAEASAETARILGRDPDLIDPNCFFVPPEILQRGLSVQRDLQVAVATAGGHLVETTNIGFAGQLYERSIAFRMGATRLPNLRGNAAIPKQTGSATTAWLELETSQAPESQQTFIQILMSPKTCAAYTEISRHLLLQGNPSADLIVERDLSISVANAVDAAAINGDGTSGAPTGILNTTGIATAAGANVDYAALLECQSDTLAANAVLDPNSAGYVTTTAVAGLLMQRVKFASTASPIWEGSMRDGEVIGHQARSTEQIPAATAIFGDWSQLLIGEWGALAVEVNPFADFRAGVVGVRCMYTVDIALRYPEAFCAVTGIT